MTARRPITLASIALMMLLALVPLLTARGAQSVDSTMTPSPTSTTTPVIPYASVSGTVYNQDRTIRVGGARIEIYNNGGTLVRFVFTSADGTYRIDNLLSGSYRLVAIADRYVSEWYLESSDSYGALLLPLAEDEDRTGIDFTITQFGQVQGVVTLQGTTTRLADVVIGLIYQSSGVMEMRTSADGTFSAWLRPGNYTFRAGSPSDGYAIEYYNQKSDWQTANVVAIGAGTTTTGINFSLERLGIIRGTVRARSTGAPIQYAEVYLVNLEGNYTLPQRTGADGTYLFRVVRPDNYRVVAYAGGYSQRWFNDKMMTTEGTVFNAAVGSEFQNVDFLLDPYAVIQVNLDLSGTGRGTPPNANWAIPFDISFTRLDSGVVEYQRSYPGNISGGFQIRDFPPAAYRLSIKVDGALSIGTDYTINPGYNTYTTPPIRLGDVNDDNRINISDFSLLAASFGKASGTTGFDARADFNADQKITIIDFAMMAQYFGQVGS